MITILHSNFSFTAHCSKTQSDESRNSFVSVFLRVVIGWNNVIRQRSRWLCHFAFFLPPSDRFSTRKSWYSHSLAASRQRFLVVSCSSVDCLWSKVRKGVSNCKTPVLDTSSGWGGLMLLGTPSPPTVLSAFPQVCQPSRASLSSRYFLPAWQGVRIAFKA